MLQRLTVWIVLIGFFTCPCLNAQQRRLELNAGAAVSFASSKSIDARYQPLILPHAGLMYHILLNEAVAIKTGIGYQVKGLKGKTHFPGDVTDTSLVTNATSRYHFMSIPLQLVYSFNTDTLRSWHIGFGMNYGFLVYARSRGTSGSYYKGQLQEAQDLDRAHYIALTPSSGSGSNDNRDELYAFSPCVRADISYQWHRRFFVTAFYEYNLNDLSSNPGSSKVNLHYSGIALGIYLR